MASNPQPPPNDEALPSGMWLDKEWYIEYDDLTKLLSVDDTDSNTQNNEAFPSKQIHPYKARHLKRDSSSKLATRKFIHYSPSSQSSIQASSFKELLYIGNETLEQMFSSDNGTPFWLDIQNPSDTDVQLLCSAFGVHPVTVEDISYREDQEKLEQSLNYFFACVRSYREVADKDETDYEPYPIYFLVFKKGILTFSFGDGQHGERVQQRIELLKDHVAINSDWIFYAFVDDIVDSFFPIIGKIEKRVDAVEDQVYNTRRADTQAFLYEIEAARRATFNMMRLVDGKSGVLFSFEQHHCTGNLQHHINDVQDHVSSQRSSLQLSESLLSRSQENYVTGIEVETMQATHRTNRWMGKIAIIAMIMTFMTMIAGLLSVNLVPPNIPPWHPFIWTLCGMLVLSLLLGLLARRYGYL